MEQTFEMQAIRLKNEQDRLILQNQNAEAVGKVEGDRDIQASRSALKERMAEREKAYSDFVQVRLRAPLA